VTKKLFITLFPEFNLVLSNKDVGAIPYHFGRTSGWRGGVLYVKSDAIPPTPEYSEQVELYAVEPSRFRPWTYVRLLLELGRMSGGIDVLNIYHGNFFSLLAASVYKLLNPKGLVYCKLDMSHMELKLLLEGPPGVFAAIIYRLKCGIKFVISRNVSFFSVESLGLYEVLRRFPFYRGRIHYIPNGFSTSSGLKVFHGKKENLILWVGRSGSYEKNGELLLEVLAGLTREDLGDWKFLFVGEATDSFRSKFYRTLSGTPWLKSASALTGHLDDRAELFSLYRRAKYICVTSRWESFGFSALEAMYFGCLPISVRLPSIMDMTDGGRLGYILEDESPEGLGAILRGLLFNRPDETKRAKDAHERVSSRFNWYSICGDLQRIITEYDR
jgi:glycosyltransferase involved in cell wall biosynthesis